MFTHMLSLVTHNILRWVRLGFLIPCVKLRLPTECGPAKME